ncbi:hypothetical protein CRYUN_Cryun13aG0022500 [Craigia yunnanensis]
MINSGLSNWSSNEKMNTNFVACMIPYFCINVLPFLLFVILLVKWLLGLPRTSNKSLPPSPPKLPILGNLHQLGRHPHRSLSSIAQRYGPDFMLLHLGSVPAIIVSSADAASEIMKTHDVIFSDRPRIGAAKKLLHKDMSTAPYGEYWRQLRSICMMQLLSNKRVQSYKTVREEEISVFLEKIKDSCLLTGPVDLTEMLVTLTGDVICRVAFGRKYSGYGIGKMFHLMLGEVMTLLGSFNLADFIPWLAWINLVNGTHFKTERVAKWLDSFLEKVIDEHMDGIKRKGSGNGSVEREDDKDFVDVLLEIQNDNTSGFSLGRDSMKALIMDIFSGGTDTTFTVLEWAMTELLRYPRVMKKLQNEVRKIGSGKPKITEDDLEKMYYLKAVIKETLRLYPPLPLLIPRVSTQDINIKGCDIAERTLVFINAWAIGRDPAHWAEPDMFLPERFLNNPIDFKGNYIQFIPFGAGRRGCPGMAFAVAMNEIVLANLVHKFDWSLPNGTTGKDLDMTETTGIAIHKNVPLLAVATPTSD